MTGATLADPGNLDCLAKAEADEPMFILLARDPAAPAVIRQWAEDRIAGHARYELDDQTEHARAARQIADAMELWREANPGKRQTAQEGTLDRFISKEAAARYVERFAQRLAAGPAVKEQAAPINRIRYGGDEVAGIVPLLNALASGLRAGLAPENDWPDAPRPEGEVFEIGTGDPRFDPEGAVIVNGYRFERAPSLPKMAMTINPSEA